MPSRLDRQRAFGPDITPITIDEILKLFLLYGKEPFKYEHSYSSWIAFKLLKAKVVRGPPNIYIQVTLTDKAIRRLEREGFST